MHDSHPRVPTDTTTVTEAVLPGVVDPDGIQVRTRPARPAGPGQVVPAMEATGVSLAEQQMRRGKYFDQPPLLFVPGYLVGRAVDVREGVSGDLVGATLRGPDQDGGLGQPRHRRRR